MGRFATVKTIALTSVRSEPLYLHLAKALNGLRIASRVDMLPSRDSG